MVNYIKFKLYIIELKQNGGYKIPRLSLYPNFLPHFSNFPVEAKSNIIYLNISTNHSETIFCY